MKKLISSMLVCCMAATLILSLVARGEIPDINPITYEPNESANQLRVTAVSAGTWHTLAILDDGSLWAWGDTDKPSEEERERMYNSWGFIWASRLGDGTNEPQLSPVKIMDNVVHAVAGEHHSLAIDADGVLWGWGRNRHGQIGDGTNETRLSPVKIMDNVVSVTPTFNGGYAVTSDGVEWWWGERRVSAEVDGQWEWWQDIQLYPIRVSERIDPPFQREPRFNYKIDENGTLWTWGINEFLDMRGGGSPLVGDGTATIFEYNRREIDGNLYDVREIIGEDNARHTPVRIMDNAVSVKTVRDTVFVIDSNGTLWAWGYNTVGQLGDGTTDPRLSPVRIMENVAYISSGRTDDHGRVGWMNTFAITTDGELWAWGGSQGFGGLGLLGDGTGGVSNSPVRILFTIPTITDEISVYINGERLEFDVPPQIIDNRTMVPMRAIFEALRYEVEWDGETQTVIATIGRSTITMQIDNDEIIVEWTEWITSQPVTPGGGAHGGMIPIPRTTTVVLDVPPMIVNDRTLVPPLRAIAEATGADVDWVADTQTVIIITN